MKDIRTLVALSLRVFGVFGGSVPGERTTEYTEYTEKNTESEMRTFEASHYCVFNFVDPYLAIIVRF